MENSNLRPFHLAIPIDNLSAAQAFYGDLLGCEKGRESEHWIDWNFFGHQLVTHLVTAMPSQPTPNNVDNKEVPVPHFGVVLNMKCWTQLSEKLRNHGVEFVIEPYTRFAGQAGEQATMFLHDPCGNALEFKAFKNLDRLFAK